MEMMMTVGILVFLVIFISFVCQACFRIWSAYQTRFTMRTELAQAMELMTRDIFNAQDITGCGSTYVTFCASLESGKAIYTYKQNNSTNLVKVISGNNVIKAINIQAPGTAWFTCGGNLVTIDMTATSSGETIHQRSIVVPRNLVTNGLVAYYKMDENSSGSCTGASIIDSTCNGYTGTCSTINEVYPTWGTGQVTYGLSLDGSNMSYVQLPLNAYYNLGPGTVALWIYLTSNSAEVIINHAGTRPYGTFSVGSYPNTGGTVFTAGNPGTLYFHARTSVNIASSTSTVSTGAWYHVAVVFDTTQVTFYINGASAGTTNGNFSMGTNAGPVDSNIGWIAAFDAYLNGTVDDLRIYNRVLSASEIKQLYTGYYPG